MKFLIFLSVLLALTAGQMQLFDQPFAGNTITYTVPNSILNPGFDNFVNAPPSQPQAVPVLANNQQQRFLQTTFDEVAPGFEKSLANQAQNMIAERDQPEPVVNYAPTPAPAVQNPDNNLSVTNLNIDGSLKVSGNVVIEKDGLRVNKETNLLMGNESLSMGKVVDMVRFAQKIKEICGENFERCSPSGDQTSETKKEVKGQPEKSEIKAKYRLKQKNSRFLEVNNKKKGKKQSGMTAEDIANNSIDLDARAKENEVESAVEKVMSDEENLTNYGESNKE